MDAISFDHTTKTRKVATRGRRPSSLQKRAFTLIELLVVIAIIGVLAAIIIAALDLVRSEGSDASIKANLVTVQTEAANYFDTNGNYSTANIAGALNACTDPTNRSMYGLDPTIKAAVAAAAANTSGGETSDYRCTARTGQNAYAVAVRSKQDPTSYWCIDSITSGPKFEQGLNMLQSNTYNCP